MQHHLLSYPVQILAFLDELNMYMDQDLRDLNVDPKSHLQSEKLSGADHARLS